MLKKPKRLGKARRAASVGKPQARKMQPASKSLRNGAKPQRKAHDNSSKKARLKGANAEAQTKPLPGAKMAAKGKHAAEEIVRHREYIYNLVVQGMHAEYEAFQAVVQQSRIVAASAAAHSAFVAVPAWDAFKKKRPTSKDRPRADRDCLRLFKGPGKIGSKLASVRWRALQALTRAGVADHELADWLKKNGGYKRALALREELEGVGESKSLHSKKSAAAETHAAAVTAKVPAARREQFRPAADPGAISVRCLVEFEPDADGLQRLPSGTRILIEAEIVNASMPLQLRFFSCKRA